MRHFFKYSLRTFIGRATFFAALLIVFGVLFGHGLPVFAQGDFGLAEVDSKIGLSGKSIVLIIVNVIRILLGFLGLVLVSMILYAGFTIMTSDGNEEKVTRGKTILKNAVIGTGIILFSFIIVQFVISILSDVTGATPGQKTPPGLESFAGIGSLGQVIQDHYPSPNQTNVYRNTKIVITFTEDIDPSSVIENTNGSCWNEDLTASSMDCDEDAPEYYGDCQGVGGQTVCDTLLEDAVTVYKLSEKGGLTDGEPVSMSAMVAYENGNEAHTFVFKLKEGELFGNGETDQWHEVEVTNNITNTKGVPIFKEYAKQAHSWEFETNTEVDLSPPYVEDVSPNPGETVEKNRMLKITFNEAVDPMAVQGLLGPTSNFSNVVIDVMGDGGEYVPPIEDQGGDVSYNASLLQTLSGFGNIPLDIVSDGEKYAYASYNSGKIVQIDIKNIKNPVFTGKTFNEVSSKSPRGLSLQGEYLYIVGGGPSSSSGTLHIIDKTTMEEVGTYNELVNPQDVVVVGSSAYVADYDNGIVVVNVENPKKPEYTSILEVGTTRVYSILERDGFLYYGGQTNPQFGVASITDDPEKLTIINEINIAQTVRDISLHGTYAYLAVGASGIKIIDITNPAKMDITQFESQDPGYDGLAAYTLSKDGQLLAVGEQHALKLFDLSINPTEPTLLISYPPLGGNALPADNFRPVWLSGQYVYMGQKDAGIQVFDMLSEASSNSGDTSGGSNTSGGVVISGHWKITNGYRTIEFLSNIPCGKNAINSCGEPLYCLPTACADYDKTCTANYTVLARTATTKDTTGNSFESASLFDGVVDMADNVLDSSPNIDSTGSIVPGSYDFLIYEHDDPVWRHKPPFVGTKKDIDVDELYSDNYWWNFTVINDIDSTSPYIHQIYPGIDQQGVLEYTPVDLYFSKEMSLVSLTEVALVEYPSTDVGLGYMHRSEDVILNVGMDTEVTKTTLHVDHPARPFGPDGTDYWYFTKVPGTIRAMNQFCLYPGRGPYSVSSQEGKSDPACEVSYDENWNITSVSASCMPQDVALESDTDTGCVSTNTGLDQVVGDVDTCIQQLSDPIVSPSVFINS